MKFTFGIPTAGDVDLSDLIQNIKDMNIPEYEILIIGGSRRNEIHIFDGDKVTGRYIPFDETTIPRWITRKKNVLAQEAQYENLVLMHDYYRLLPDWYTGWVRFGNDFDVAINKVHDMNGNRFADWLINPELYQRTFGYKHHKWALPYNISVPKLQYISGGYFLVKKDFLLKHPLDETKKWGECEDTEWCERIYNHTKMRMNTFSTVMVTKPKWSVFDADMDDVKNFADILDTEIEYL
jgi:hypothetical protein